MSKISGIDGLVWITHQPLNSEILDAAGPQLKSIATMSVGYDHIDVKEIKSRGLPISNTPSVLNDAVADIATGLMVAASRRFHEGRLKIEQLRIHKIDLVKNSLYQFYFITSRSKWEKGAQWMLGQDLTLKTFGIVGLGEIGQTIAHRLKGFTKPNEIPKIIYCGNSRKPEGNIFSIND